MVDAAGGDRSTAAAVAAAEDAVRNSARLVRLLTVLGRTGSAEDLVDETVTALSDAFAAEVVCLVGSDPGTDHMTVIGACGLPEGHPGFTTGWPTCSAGRSVLASGRAAWAAAGPDDPNVPCSLASFEIRSAAWVPVGGRDAVQQLLVLYRGSGEPFGATDLEVLTSLATRLGVSIEARERGFALERLALAGHRLARHLDVAGLLEEAAALFQELTGAASVAVLQIEDERLVLRASRGVDDEGARRWPHPGHDLDAWPDLAAGRLWHGIESMSGEARSALYVPVLTNGTLAVVLRLAGHRPGSLRSSIEVAGPLAAHLGVVLENISLYGALHRSETSLRLITDAINDLVAVVDGHGRLSYVSPSHRRGLHRDPDDLRGRLLLDTVHPDDRGRVAAALAAAASSAVVECRVASGDGGWTWVESVLRTATEGGPDVVLSSRVIEERKRLEDELLHRATHDALTGLANRSLATSRIERALTDRDAPDIGALFCDLDKFKAVNDRLGHDAGDDLLRQVAARLGQALRAGDMLARFGGDEFVVIVEDVHSPDDLEDVGQRLLRALDEPFLIAGESLRVSASIGGVLVSESSRADPGALLRDADAAMYASKEAGRARLTVFDEEASRRSLDRWSLRADLIDALARQEFVLHYQPIVDLATSRIVALEALIRWQHPARGLIRPDQFIPMTEETGTIVDIGRWALRTACHQLGEWRRLPGAGDLAMHVNVSPVQLLDPHLADTAMGILQDAAVPADAVWLEVTERGTLSADAGAGVAALRARGVRCALDDFGMSSSNLEYLKSVHVDALKIDKSFVAGAADDPADVAIVRAVLGIAESLGLAVVAEGVEQERQRDALLSLGCLLGQGYLFSAPVPPDAMAAMLSARVPSQGPRAAVRRPAAGPARNQSA